MIIRLARLLAGIGTSQLLFRRENDGPSGAAVTPHSKDVAAPGPIATAGVLRKIRELVDVRARLVPELSLTSYF